MFHRNRSLNCGSSRPLYENELICESHKPELHPVGGPSAALAEASQKSGMVWVGRGLSAVSLHEGNVGPLAPRGLKHPSPSAGRSRGARPQPWCPASAQTVPSPCCPCLAWLSSGSFLMTLFNCLHCLHSRGDAGSLTSVPSTGLRGTWGAWGTSSPATAPGIPKRWLVLLMPPLKK